MAKSKSCREGGRNVICLVLGTFCGCGCCWDSSSCSSMAGCCGGDGATRRILEVRMQFWRWCPLLLSFGVEGLVLGSDSVSHSSGLLVAIECGRSSRNCEIGLPSLPETGCKTEVDARLLLVSSWMVKSVPRQRGDDGEMPRLSLLLSGLLGTATLDFVLVLDGSLAKDALDSARDGPCRDIESDSLLLLLLGRLSWKLAQKDRCVFNCGRNDICFAAPKGLVLPSS